MPQPTTGNSGNGRRPSGSAPVGWRELTTGITGVWDHKPKPGRQLRMAKDLVARGPGR